jgi:hypothetical protein
LAIAPDQQSDQKMRSNLRTMAGSKNADVVQGAFDVWVGHTEEKDAETLLFKALESQDIERRHAALRVMDLHKLGTSKQRVAAYTLDLQEREATCEQRAEAIPKLRGIGDPGAIPALERAMTVKGTRGAMRGKLLNACMIDDLRAAIHALNQKK